MIDSHALNLVGVKEHYNATNRFIEENVKKGLGEKVAIYSDDKSLTYNELLTRVNQIGDAFKKIHVESENRVLLLAYDSAEFIVTFYGAMKIGAVPIPVNTMLPTQDYEYLLNDSRAKVLVVESEIWQKMKENKERFIYLKHVIVIDTKEKGAHEELDFYRFLNTGSEGCQTYHSGAEDPGFWLYSSGSTGKPKGVIHQQQNMEAALENYAKNILNMTEDDITFSASKLFFAYGLGNGMYFPLGVGGTTVLMSERPKPDKVFEQIEKAKPTIFFGVPTLYGAMLNYVEQTGIVPDLSSIRVCVSAGEALPASFYKRWKEVFQLDILDGIGSTEALHIFLSNRIGDIQPGSTGKLVPGYEAKILNDQSIELGPNEVGDLVIKGDSLTGGYWCNKKENQRKFYGEWMHTGDKYYLDENGYFWYSGRSDDMLKVGGIWVSPIEIENILFQHPKVLEVAVVGKETANHLVYPKAYIVLKAGIEGTEMLKDELRLYVKEHLAPYKYPREIEFIDDLPKTASGKIQRFRLRV
ncbi:benzoate-CoA ligase family protein [Alkalihalobacillus sp. 1P02AB]|uniref:benzoate-CoA ligase family protein n=1 Tax=Alkalihalobacillus sp. 1P02AB TaxID=3132260 RepID=UPI0039A5A420